jgi:hypothetical protein
MKSLLDPMGLGVREGKEAEYNELMQDLSDDINSVKARKTPKYLSKPTKKKATPEILAAYMKKAGNNKKKAREMLLKDNYDLNG